jgi:Flp pilus assembly protein TadG
MTVLARSRDSERGAVAAEFALLLPAFLAVVGSIFFAGWLGTVKTILDHGAREGAHFATIRDPESPGDYPSEAAVTAEVEATTPLLSPTSVTLTTSDAGTGRNAPVRVTVTYEVPNPVSALLAPLAIFGVPLPDGSITVTSSAEERFE